MKRTALVTDLGRHAREARKDRGWTQKQAAEAAGLSLRRYGDIERGEANNITSETIEAITRNILLAENAASVREPTTGYADASGKGATQEMFTGSQFAIVFKAGKARIRVPVMVTGPSEVVGDVEIVASDPEIENPPVR